MTRWMTEELMSERFAVDEVAFMAVLVAASRKNGRGVEPMALVSYEPRLFPDLNTATLELEKLEKEGVFIRLDVQRGAVCAKTVWVASDLARRALALHVGATAFVRGALEPAE